MTGVNEACEEIRRVASSLAALGCTPDEVAEVSSVQGVSLPASYRCFLETMGRDGGGCFEFEFATYPYVLQLRADAVRELDGYAEGSPDAFSLPDDAAVISMIDQGYAFMFLRASMGDDPPVEVWSEGTEVSYPKVVYSSVLEWIQHAYQSTTASSGREESRREHQRRLRRAFVPPSCPSCRADWSNYEEVQVHQDLMYIGTDNATIVVCRECAGRFDWWWGQPPRPTRRQ